MLKREKYKVHKLNIKQMNLKNATTEDLLVELKNRNTNTNVNTVLVFGTIGIDGGTNFVEVFKKINSQEDLDDLSNICLRARFNSHRYYQGFFFKTDNFDDLENHLNEDNESFANWIRECDSVKYIKL